MTASPRSKWSEPLSSKYERAKQPMNARVRGMYRAGLSIQAIAVQLDVNPNTVELLIDQWFTKMSKDQREAVKQQRRAMVPL